MSGSRQRRLWLAVGRGVLGAALLVYVLRTGGAWTQLRELFGVLWLVALLNAFPLVGATVEALRLGVLFGAQHLHLPFRIGVRVVAIGALFNLWIPGGTGGDVMKLYYIAGRHTGRGVEVATILLVDRAVALFALLTLILALLLIQRPLMLVPVIRGATIGVAVVLGAILAGTAFIWSARIRASAVYRGVLARVPLGRHIARAADAAYRFRDHKTAILKAALLSMTGHALLAVTFAIAGTVLVPGLPPLVVGTLSLLGLVANALPVTPGGLGVGEAASEALFRSVGVPGGASLIAAWRVGTILICVLGAAYYIRGMRAPARDTRSASEGTT
jgi:glycosyltransferase 2 family protein